MLEPSGSVGGWNQGPQTDDDSDDPSQDDDIFIHLGHRTPLRRVILKSFRMRREFKPSFLSLLLHV